MSNEKKEIVKQQKTDNQKNSKSPYLERLLAKSESRKAEIKDNLEKMNPSVIDNAYAFSKIMQVINANEKIKVERNARKFNKNGPRINTEYDVVIADDKLSKRVMSILKNIRNLSENEAMNVHNGFVSNNYQEVMQILDSNNKFITDCNELVRIMSSAVATKAKSGAYKEHSMFVEIIKHIGLDSAKAIISELENDDSKKEKEEVKKEKAA